MYLYFLWIARISGRFSDNEVSNNAAMSRFRESFLALVAA